METKISKLTFWNIWLSYALYYFGKVNLGIVVPVLLVVFSNLSLYNVGLVSSAFFMAYAIGQFLHGHISEKYNPFVYISIGLIGSALMNFILGWWGGLFFVLVVGEFMDGLFQSMGWSSCVRANALMQDKKNREKSSVILGTSYQIGNSIAWLVCATVVGWWGWQAGFFVASAVLFLRGVTLLITKPKIDLSNIEKRKIKTQIKKTLISPVILGGIALCLLNMIRFGIITWIPLYLFQQGSLTVASMGSVGWKICLLPLAGVIGTLCYNKIKKDKELLTIIFCGILSVVFVVLAFLTEWWALVFLLIGSFLIYGPHVFLVSTLPTRFVDKQITASSTGFIDGMGYVGTILIGIIVPFLLSVSSYGWACVFIFWAVLAFIISIIVLVIYKYEK